MSENPFQAPQVIDPPRSRHDSLNKTPAELIVMAGRLRQLGVATLVQWAWMLIAGLAYGITNDTDESAVAGIVNSLLCIVVTVFVFRAALCAYTALQAGILAFCGFMPCFNLLIVGLVFHRLVTLLRFNGIPVQGWRIPSRKTLEEYFELVNEPNCD